MKVYVIQVCHEGHASKVLQVGYCTLEDAQAFIESRTNHPVKCINFYHQTKIFGEYYICEVSV